nr:hypothetical protein [Corynebacterium sp. MSK293]
RNRVLSHPAHQHRAVKEAELNPGRFTGYGWSSITNLENIDTFTRQLKPEETPGYQPTSHIRAYTQGRDLTCR